MRVELPSINNELFLSPDLSSNETFFLASIKVKFLTLGRGCVFQQIWLRLESVLSGWIVAFGVVVKALSSPRE